MRSPEKTRPDTVTKLSADDRAVVAHIASLLRAAVLRQAGDEADRIAERVVARMAEERQPAEGVVVVAAVYITVDEAAKMLGITRDAMDKRIQRRQVPGVMRTAGRRVQIHREKFLAGLERRGR